MDVSLPGSPFRPAMGRYSLLPSASNWASVSEEAENVTSVAEGTSYFVLFHCIIMFCLLVTNLHGLFPFSCSKAQLSLGLLFPENIHLSTVIARLNS